MDTGQAVAEKWWADLLKRADVKRPHDRARDMMILMEGAKAMILIHRDQSYAYTATRAALQIIRKSAQE